MFSERQRKILSLLEEHQRTGVELAALLGVSTKTVRTDIKLMLEELPSKIASLHISTRYGYRLEIKNVTAFHNFLAQAPSIMEVKERDAYVMERLLLATLLNEPIAQMDLAEEIFVGLSTLKESLKHVRKHLAHLQVIIENYKNRGMLLMGEEEHLREALLTYFFGNHKLRAEFQQKLEAKIQRSKLREILLHVTASYDITFTDEAVQSLLDAIIITLFRSQHGHHQNFMMHETKEYDDKIEMRMAEAIFEEIYQVFSLDIDTSEIYSLTRHLLASRRYEKEKVATSNIYAKTLVTQILARVFTLTNFDFRQDMKLQNSLQAHLEVLIPRLRFHIPAESAGLRLMKNHHPLAFQIGVIAAKVIEETESLPVSENEMGYLAVHFGAALSRRRATRRNMKVRVLLICGSGMGMATLLRERLQEIFGSRVEVVGVSPGYALDQKHLEGIDLLLSTLGKEDLPKLLPEAAQKLFVIKHMLDEEEEKHLRERLDKSVCNIFNSILRFFRPETFYASGDFKTRTEVLQFLTKRLLNLGLMDEQAAKSVFDHEKSSPTELGNLVTIPHPIENLTSISSVSVLVLNHPILWENAPAQIIFLMSIAKDEFFLWEPIFLRIFHMAKANAFKEILLHPDYGKFLSLVRQHLQ